MLWCIFNELSTVVKCVNSDGRSLWTECLCLPQIHMLESQCNGFRRRLGVFKRDVSVERKVRSLAEEADKDDAWGGTEGGK